MGRKRTKDIPVKWNELKSNSITFRVTSVTKQSIAEVAQELNLTKAEVLEYLFRLPRDRVVDFLRTNWSEQFAAK